jgi:hypothetical protein
MAEDEDPIVGAGGANKPEKETKADNDSPLPSPKDDSEESTSGKHRSPDD